MSQNTFEVLFSGKLVEGAAIEKVKASVAALFKVEVTKVERLFSGATVTIKKGVDEATAKKYQQALYKVGAITQVVNRAEVAESPKPAAAATPKAAPQPTPKPAPAAQSNVTKSGLQKSVVKEAPAGLGEVEGASVDLPGAVLVEHEELPVPDIDTAGLSMDFPGADLVEAQPMEELAVDTSAITLGEAGEVLAEEEAFVPLDVDTSTISMDEPGATLAEHEEVPEPQIDTSKLSLD